MSEQSPIPPSDETVDVPSAAIGVRGSPAAALEVNLPAGAPGNGAGTRSPGSSAAGSGSGLASSFDHGRFVPGTMIAGRYRIVALLGHGGMGEVYRADDLKLGQAVALKFLLATMASDPARIARLHNEVRLAREIAHPNVCRVYDIGEADGHQFLSMQYVDGENLASLLRRIGRFPEDKALETARQLAAGLAAAHERGVIHRDLKPSNVMIDGRGHVLITDFGLSGLIDHIPGTDLRAGTPAYMAPEQLAGRQVSVRSDLYALGLVLYEVFTGRPVHKAGTLEELMKLRDAETSVSMTAGLHGLDPSIETLILRCLEPDPARRPSSALSVMAALPGGDPLAAALAAGETPSPEMVAAAGGRGSLRLRTGLALLAFILVGMLAIGLVHTFVPAAAPIVPVSLHPAILADRAAQMVREFGYPDPPGDRAYGMGINEEQLQWIERGAAESGAAAGDAVLGDATTDAGFFWYRESPRPLSPVNPANPVALDDPPSNAPGMISVVLNRDGRLLSFTAQGPAHAPPASRPAEVDWSVFFQRAGLDRGHFQVTLPIRNPGTYCDARQAWVATTAAPLGTPVRIEAASLAGRPVVFAVLRAWEIPEPGVRPVGAPLGERIMRGIGLTIRWLTYVAGAFLAVRNVRLGRSDRRGALRIAIAVFLVAAVAYLLRAPHRFPAMQEHMRLLTCTSMGLWFAVTAWMFYLALEPYVRRIKPEWLVSWTRMVNGWPRDPLVGRDLLIGLACGLGVLVINALLSAVAATMGMHLPRLILPDAAAANRSARDAISAVLIDLAAAGVMTASMVTFLAVGLLLVTRKRRVAGPLLCLLLFLLYVSMLTGGTAWVAAAFALVMAAGTVTALARGGLLAMAVSLAVVILLLQFAPTLNLGVWYATNVWMVSAAVVAIALYSFRQATRGQALFSDRTVVIGR